MRLWPRRGGASETKSMDVMPEALWDLLQANPSLFTGMENAVGLPAVLSVIRLLSHAAALVPFNVIREQDGIATRARDTWQWRLLNKRPGAAPLTAFAFKADIAANFAGRGNAYVRKLKPSMLQPGRPRVIEFMSLDAGKIKPRRATTGDVVFDDRTTGSQPITRGTDEIIQIRSFSLGDGLEGLSPITSARMLVSAGLRRQQFEDKHLANGIFPGIGLTYPAGVDQDTAEKWIKAIEKRHQGTGKAGKVIAVGGGAQLIPIPISLEDAQFAQATRLTIEQAAAMYQVPLVFFNPTAKPSPDDWRFFTTFALGPIVEAMSQAFNADQDLFNADLDEEDLEAIGDPDVLLKLDAATKATVQHTQIQDGLRLVDELRALDGLGPLPPVPEDWTQTPGQVPQITPVGGAPNPTAGTGDPVPAPAPAPAATD